MRQTIVTMLILFLIIGCNQQEQSNSNKGLTINENGVPQYSDVKSGGVKMITVAGKYKVWTKKIGQGKINREIAEDLVVSERTVESHVSNIMFKLGVQSRRQIREWAREKGLISLH